MPKSRLNDFFELESNSAENRALIRPSLDLIGSSTFTGAISTAGGLLLFVRRIQKQTQRRDKESKSCLFKVNAQTDD